MVGLCRLENYWGDIGGRWIGGIALEQHFAADAMQFRVESAMTDPLGRRQRFIEDRKRAVNIACVRGYTSKNVEGSRTGQRVFLN